MIITKILAAVVGITVGGVLGMWTLDRDVDVVYIANYAIERNIKAGEILTVEYTMKKGEACTTIVSRRMKDSAGTIYNISESFIPDRQIYGIETFRRQYIVPISMTKGPAVLYLHQTYACNPLHAFWPIHRFPPVEIHFNVI